MGRRKERRAAAAASSSRRVKLDLFAEPSGDLGGSSPQDEVGGEDDSKNRAGLFNSPSSSGKPQNPLLLLGQYSDDELDDGSKGTNTDTADGSFAEDDKQASKNDKENGDTGVNGDKENGDTGVNGGDESVSKKVEEFIMEMDSMEKAGEDDQVAEEATNLTNFNGDLHLSEKTAPATSDNQGTSSGWKMVLHEESNQYYYWNIETGETSWEAPNVLDLTTESIYGDKEAIDGRQEDASLTEQIDGLISDGCVDRSTLINGNNSHGSVFEAVHEGSKVNASEEKKEGDDGHQGTLQSSYCSLDAQYNEMPVGGVSSTSLGDTNVGYQNASVGDPVVCGPDMRRLGEYEDGSKLSYHLMGHCESLLEQLRSMNRSKDNFELRCIVEVETRLHDIKSLASHGSSLLPFLVHSEKQLLQLTATIKDKIGKDECVQMNEIDNAHKPDGSDGANLIAGSAMNVLDRATYEGSDVLSSDECQKKFGAYENGTLATEHDSSASDVEGTSDLDRLATQDGTTSNAILHSGDDADMDVDMEVEDVLPPEMSTSEIHIAPLQSLPSMLSENLEVSTPEQAFSVPPPPDGDWIPPPPPDDEPFPPPPPEEPPESTQPPPPGSEQAHIFSYAEQYNQSYSGADIVYYGQTEFPSSNLYNTYSDAHQAAIPQSSVYYNSGQPAFGAIPVGEPGAYYTLQDAASNPTSAAGLEPSIIGSVSGFTSFCPDSSGSINVHPPASYSLLPVTKDDGAVSEETGNASREVPSSQPTVLITETASVPSTSAAPASATVGAAASKGQTKVSRIKKRTGAVVSTMRSSKKVSSLVDKWKAAKEEMMEEEEEEPETYIEKLEKKRQREIEEWRAKQIASGEAKENANFQPLGGDWRERVKRKRAKLAKEVDQSPSKGSTGRTEQPDLNELSKGLPSGWQVYWDDSSKQVYYGNTITSETSWTRPTN